MRLNLSALHRILSFIYHTSLYLSLQYFITENLISQQQRDNGARCVMTLICDSFLSVGEQPASVKLSDNNHPHLHIRTKHEARAQLNCRRLVQNESKCSKANVLLIKLAGF